MSQQLAHRWDMPESGLLCRRCRSGLCGEGETWCQLCSCAHALGEVARNRFSYPTHRALADEIAYQAVRQVRALVEVDRQTHSQVTSLSDRLENSNRRLREVTVSIDKSAQPKRQPSRPREEDTVKREPREEERPDSPQEVDYGSEESYEESGEEEQEAERDPPRVPDVPPPPPPPRNPGTERPVSPSEPPRGRESRGHRDRSRSRHRGRRGGSRHRQHHRGLADPQSIFEPKTPKKKRKKKHNPPRGDGGGRREAHR